MKPAKGKMSNILKRTSIRSLARWLKMVWPQVPLGLFLFFVGAINILTGIQSRAFRPVFQLLASVTSISELSKEISLGILGSSVQVLLGTGLLLTGIGLLWRLRSAWAFSILLLTIAVILDLFNQRDAYGALLSGLALAALIIWERRFSRRSLIGVYLMSLIGLLSVLAYGTLGSLLLGSSFHPAIQDIYTALYFTVVTLSTVGSNIYPSTSEAQLFMVTLILGGISIFTTTIVTTLGPLLSNQIKPILAGKNAKKYSTDQVVLVGTDSFIESLAHELAGFGINFTQVTTSKDTPFSSEEMLKHTELSSATTVIIAGESTAEKTTVAQSAKNLNPGVRLVIIVDSADAIVQFNSIHADLIFVPQIVAARTLARLLIGVAVSKELQDIIKIDG